MPADVQPPFIKQTTTNFVKLLMPHPAETTLILTGEDVAKIVRCVGCHQFMDQLIERLQQAFAGFEPSNVTVPVRDGFHYDVPVTGLVEWMPLYQHGRSVLMKMVGYHPENPTCRLLPTVLSTLSLFDAATGSLTTIADGVLLTAIRTGAASAVATRLLSSENSRTLGLIGCGAQAVTQLHAVSRVRDLEVVRYCDTDPVVMESFPVRVAALLDDNVRLLPCSLQEVVESVDILCTATSVGSGKGPIFDNCSTSPAIHINAVGSDLSGKTELPLNLLLQSFVCPDFPEQARHEGECQQLTTAQIGPSLLQLTRRPEQWPDVMSQRTVFDSTGWALEDSVALELAVEHALKLGIGSRVPIEARNSNPWNPYEGLYLTTHNTAPAERLLSVEPITR